LKDQKRHEKKKKASHPSTKRLYVRDSAQFIQLADG